MASLPYCTDPGPFRISIRSIDPTSTWLKNALGPLNSRPLLMRMPSTKYNTVLPIMPRTTGVPPPVPVF